MLDKSGCLKYYKHIKKLETEGIAIKIDIRRHREAAGLTQKELAEKMGYGQSCVTNWETGVSLPRTADLPKLAAVLGVTVDELLRETSGEGDTA